MGKEGKGWTGAGKVTHGWIPPSRSCGPNRRQTVLAWHQESLNLPCLADQGTWKAHRSIKSTRQPDAVCMPVIPVRCSVHACNPSQMQCACLQSQHLGSRGIWTRAQSHPWLLVHSRPVKDMRLLSLRKKEKGEEKRD